MRACWDPLADHEPFWWALKVEGHDRVAVQELEGPPEVGEVVHHAQPLGAYDSGSAPVFV